jgi:hypothetical protein
MKNIISTEIRPFFTIVIPTMNRPQLLKSAIKSVLLQTFDDYELIVSDNSNEKRCFKQNEETIAEWHADHRFKYIKPMKWMNMPDHWEFATNQASGNYVVILTDRHVLFAIHSKSSLIH